MKKPITILVLGIGILLLSSWGPEGHSTVALIAQNHLTPKAQAAVKAILGKPMSSISSWADAYRDVDPTTANWHFLNTNLGMNQTQFRQAVLDQKIPNVYNQLQRLVKELSNPATPSLRKDTNLMFLVHFVGDAHQPMHISRKEDLGGGTIHITFEGNATSLHKLWDSGLFSVDEANFTKLAAKVDKAAPAQIQQWQKDDMLQWLWESYQISSTQYSSVHNGSVLNEAYARVNIPIAEQRAEMAGIRLAGILNNIFK